MFRLKTEIHFNLILLLIPLLNINLYNRNKILFHPCHHWREMNYASILTLLSWRLSPCTATHRNNHFHPYYHGSYTILQLYYSSNSFSHFVFGYYDPIHFFSVTAAGFKPRINQLWVQESWEFFNNLILNLSHFLHELRLSPLFYWQLLQIQFWRALGEQVSPSDRRSGVKHNGILFPSFSLLTVGYHSSFHTSLHYFSPRWSNKVFAGREFSLLTVGNYGTFSLLTVGYTDNLNMAPEGIFPTQSWQHWLFQIWRRREIFPTHSWQHWQFQIWRRRGVTWPGK